MSPSSFDLALGSVVLADFCDDVGFTVAGLGMSFSVSGWYPK